MKKAITILMGLVLLSALPAFAQVTLSSTTLSAAVADKDDTVLTVASATGITAGNTLLYIDREAMDVIAVSGTSITVSRGTRGTRAMPHASGTVVFLGLPKYFVANDLHGACTSTNELVLPRINIMNGKIFRCTSSLWELEERHGASYIAPTGLNLDLETLSDGKPVRINSRNYTQTSGSSIGFQSKPAQTVGSSGNVIGAEISPRVNDTIALSGSGSVIGLHVDSYLKGTSAGTIAGDVRGLNIELVTDDAGTRTVSGNVSAIRIRAAFSATTITGKFVPIRIEKAETQTNSKQFDAVLELPSTVPLVWNSAPGTEPSTADGYIKVLVNGAVRYIQLYSGAPVD